MSIVRVSSPSPRVSSRSTSQNRREYHHLFAQINKMQTKMWANAQRDGRPAEYR